MESQRYAVLDIGTVTTRLLIAEQTGGGLDTLVRKSAITQLGEGLSETGMIGEAALARVGEAIGGYLSDISASGARLVACVATSAARDASNSHELSEMLAGLGVELDIIPGSEEALLTFSGIASAFPDTSMLTCDIGGGSTELVFGDACVLEDESVASTIRQSRSFDIGARRMTDLYLGSGVVDPADIARLADDVAGQLEEGFFSKLAVTPSQLIAVAGTATSAAAMLHKMEVYDSARVHGSRIDACELDALVDRLSRMTLGQRQQVAGLESKRAGIIVAGLVILSCVLRCSGLGYMTISESDILQGILISRI